MTEQNGRVRLYLADIRPLYQEKMQQRALALVDAQRWQKAEACRTPGGRAASLTTGILADYALRLNGLTGCRVCYDEKGKPRIWKKAAAGPGFDGPEPAYISLSHSGDYCVCAVSAVPVGVDIQKKGQVYTGMLRHFFAEAERLEFSEKYGLSEEAKLLPKEAAEAFMQLWTVKESYMKLTGTGMAAGFANLKVDPGSATVWEERRKEGPVAVWTQYDAPEGYFLTACRQKETL